ncbi:hypothetical protein IMZ48_36035 [Candidatus Bathyarchaeota archaeon]|nr:hypothetical protein [Candidatus Bathyarchaeota archaeon]
MAHTCANCEAEGSLLTCECAKTWNGRAITTVDLGKFIMGRLHELGGGADGVVDDVMKNVDGIISCHDFLGKEVAYPRK